MEFVTIGMSFFFELFNQMRSVSFDKVKRLIDNRLAMHNFVLFCFFDTSHFFFCHIYSYKLSMIYASNFYQHSCRYVNILPEFNDESNFIHHLVLGLSCLKHSIGT